MMAAKAQILLLTFLLFLNCNNYCEAQLTSTLLRSLPFQAARASSNNSHSGLQFRHRQVLSETKGSILEWELDRPQEENSIITFNYTTSIDNANATSTVYIFGISRSGQVEGADVIALMLDNLVSSSEQFRIVDSHGVNNETLSPDIVQNWNLISAQRNSSHVSFVISRPLKTCDEQDQAINNDLIYIIWGRSSGSTTGNGSINFTLEGSVPAYLTDPTIFPSEEDEEIQTWRLSRMFQIPARHTSYWCTIHRGPELLMKHHIVGIAPYLADDLSRRHVHHQLVHRCFAPPGVDPALLFEKYIGHPGEECYLEDTHHLPTSFCTEMFYVWGVGGNTFYLPKNVGIAFGETRNEYFMLETHYDNPESRSDLMIETGFDFFYSEKLRENDGGVMYIGTGLHSLHQMPPGAREFTITGHCSAECTKEMVPPSGMEIVSAMLHSHETGRKITLKHFRGNEELAWIQSDKNYDFSFQQMRLLQVPVKILPGDHLATECVLDTMSRNTTTLSGFSTKDEMCLAFIVLTKRLPYYFCSSEYPTARTMERYGITNMTWSREDQERIIRAAENPEFVGLPLSQVMDEVDGTDWTPERIRELEREQLYEEHESSCPPMKYVMEFGHSLVLADGVTGGLIPGQEIVEQFTPSTSTIRTTLLPIRTTRYPTGVSTYVPPQTCAQSV